MNESTSDFHKTCSVPAWLSIVYIIAGTAIAFENILMIIVLIQTSRLRNVVNIFVTSLAVTDAIVGLTTLTSGIVFSIVRPAHQMFHVCFIAIVACSLSTTISAYLHVSVIAIDRYLYIVHPFFYSRYINEKLVMITVLVLWIAAIIFVVAIVLIVTNGNFCYVMDLMSLDSVLCGSIMSLLLLVLTLFVYFRIAVFSLKHRRMITTVRVAVLSSPPPDGDTTRVSHSQESRKQMLKTIRFFLAVTGSFALMTVPPVICNIIYRYDPKIDNQAVNFVILLPTLQSGFNFFINIFMYSDFRQAVKRLLLCGVTKLDK